MFHFQTQKFSKNLGILETGSHDILQTVSHGILQTESHSILQTAGAGIMQTGGVMESCKHRVIWNRASTERYGILHTGDLEF